MEALKAARQQNIVKDADWVWIADVDEFLNIHVGDHTIPALIAACKTPQAISITFQFMANAGIEAFEDRPVIEQFVMTHNPDIWCGETAIEVKSLVRGDFPLGYYGAHRPFHNTRRAQDKQPTWTDGSGRPVSRPFRNRENRRRIRAFPAKGARDLATLNHYALRSLESYLVKNDRGDVNREHRAFDDSYWRERNDAAWHDRSITRHLVSLQAEIERLKTLPRVAELHDGAVRRHKARARTLLQDDSYRAMADALRRASPYPVAEAKLRALIGMDT